MSKMKSGAILSYVSLFITLITAILYTPIMIRILGQSEYGLYALIGSVTAYLSIMDMGLGNAIIRYTARNRAIGDKIAESKLNGLFLVLYSFIGLLTILIGIILLLNIGNIFGKSLTLSELEKAKIMVIILIGNFALSFPLSVFGSILEAYENFIIVRSISIIRSILVPIITLPLLLFGYGAVSMVIVTTVVNVTCLLFNVYYCFKYLKINFYFGKIDFQALKEILGYSFFVFLGVIVDQIYWNTDQFILGVVAGTVPVAVYAIAMQFIRIYMQFSTSLSGVFLPRVSIMIANNASIKELTGMMIKYGRLQYIIMAYILSGFTLFGKSFITIWAGINYSNAYYIVLVIMVPLTIPLIQNMGISILYAKNLQGFRSLILIFIAILNVSISIPLAKNYGGFGAALATAMSLTIGNSIIMNIYYHRKIGINIPLFWRNILFITIPVVVSLLIGVGTNIVILGNSLVLLFYKIVIFSIVFSTLIWLFLNKFERELIISSVKSIKNFLLRSRRKIRQ